MSTTPSNTPPNTNHLHYGGSINPKSRRLGPKPSLGNQYKKIKRLETMVRLEVAQFGEAATAAMLGISVPRLRYIKKSPDYLVARIKITHGIILDQDKDLAQIKEQRREILTQMLPPALQTLANELSQPAQTLAERKHKAGIALELLDREGTFAKISRTEVKPVDAFDFERADAESRSVINTLRGIAPAPTKSATPTSSLSTVTNSIDAVEANTEFSNSHTLSAMDQQKALDDLEKAAADVDLLELTPVKGPVQ